MDSTTPMKRESFVKGRFGRFVGELRRRKVLQSAAAYLFGAFIAMQVVDDVVPYIPGVEDPEAAGRLVLIALVVCFPIAMVLAWFVDFVPPRWVPGVSREDVGANEARALAPREPKELRPGSVAVLPFDNLSDDPENEYFSDGITEDITSALARLRGLHVISRSSVQRFKGQKRPANEVGAELGVATLVTGSVRRSGSHVRIVAKVVDARTDDHLWTETYDRGLENIFEVQSEVAARVGEAIQREVTAADRRRIEVRGTSNPEAYDLYLRARFLWNERSEASVAASIRFFERALERDPEFALAHSGLAEAYTILGIYGLRAPGDVMEVARQSAETALGIDPELGEALATRAAVAAVYDWDWGAAEEGFRASLELVPSSPTAHQWYAINLLAPQRRFEDAREQLELARSLDPESGAIATSRGILTFYAGRTEAAAAELEEVTRLHPRFSLAYYFLGQCYELLGHSEQAVDTLRTAVALAEESSETLAALGHALASAGDVDEALAILARLERRAGDGYVSPALLAQVLVGLGRDEEALAKLEEAADVRATDLIWLGVRPVYDGLRASPRVQALLARLGLADAG